MYKITMFIKRIKRLWKYIPMIWSSYDFDYQYTENILREKLKDQLKDLASHEYMYMDCNYSKLKSLKIAITILDRRNSDWYTEYWSSNKKGEMRMRKVSQEKYDEVPEKWKTGEDLYEIYTNETPEEEKYNRELLKASEECRIRDWRIFCNILNNYFEHWWS